MIIVYRKATNLIEQVVTVFGEGYLDWINAQQDLGYVEMEGSLMPHEIALISDPVDPTIVTAQPRLAFEIFGPAEVPMAVVAGVEVAFSNIPEGTLVTGDAGQGTVEADGLVEVTFEDPGAYSILFEHPLYLTKEISLEVAAQ